MVLALTEVGMLQGGKEFVLLWQHWFEMAGIRSGETISDLRSPKARNIWKLLTYRLYC